MQISLHDVIVSS